MPSGKWLSSCCKHLPSKPPPQGSLGVMSLGVMSLGVMSLGVMSLGVMSLGVMSLDVMSLGVMLHTLLEVCRAARPVAHMHTTISML